MTLSWTTLRDHARTLPSLAALFASEPDRFEALSIRLPGLFADLSKNLVSAETLRLLCAFARDAGLEHKRDAMFAGETINITENRAVLHTALRAGLQAKITVAGRDVMPEVRGVLDRMTAFARDIRDGGWKGHTGEEITHIVNIGIGGSSLGPECAALALSHLHHPRLTCHYVSNVEASDLARVLAAVDPRRTLFLVASKTFTTAETMQNATVARDWLVAAHGGDTACVARHFAALSTNVEAAARFGIAPGNVYPFWDWVGGRYSVWSAVGLSVMIMTGPEAFLDFLSGARAMDDHFRSAPLERNLPALLGLIGAFYRTAMDLPAYAVIPYHSALKRVPAWLQQVDMESNGKQGAVKTGPIVFGEPGTDAQHSFFQWLHQGADVVPVDFIAAVKPTAGDEKRQAALLSNCLAQAEALMKGQAPAGEPHRFFPGNRPSTTILLDELTPATLGMLLALYEHKVFVQGVLWGINSFDQFGVELGKTLAKTIEAELTARTPAAHDASTTGLMRHVLSLS